METAKETAMVFGEFIVWYLFLGGTAAGTFAILAVADLYAACSRFGFRRLRANCDCRSRVAAQRYISRAGYGASFVLLVAGMLCLLADLGRPEAFYLLFLYPTSSFVSVGAFALTLFGVCLAVTLADCALVLGSAWRKAALVAKIVGTILAVVIMVYTGMLLKSVVAVDVWQSAWLPVLFLFSALSCGCGVVLLCACLYVSYSGVLAWIRSVTVADAACVVLEACSAVLFALTVHIAGSASFFSFLKGSQAYAFWFGFVGCGILVPLLIELSALVARRGRESNAVAVLAVLVLIGGFSLRFVLVSAGVQTAV